MPRIFTAVFRLIRVFPWHPCLKERGLRVFVQTVGKGVEHRGTKTQSFLSLIRKTLCLRASVFNLPQY